MSVLVRQIKYCPFAWIADYFAEEQDVAILESSLINELGRYSVLGRCPYLRIEKKKGILFVNGEKQTEKFEDYVKNYLIQNQEKNYTDLPLVSGAIGFFSYDGGRKTETEVPERLLLFYDQFWISDHKKKECFFISNGKTELSEKAYKKAQEVSEHLEETHKKQNILTEHKKHYDIQQSFDFTREEYEESVREVMRNITEGEVYIANMTQRLFLKKNQTPYQLYRQMRTQNPAPFSAYFNQNKYEIVCTSPERFLQIKNGRAVTRPIKGTRPRSAIPQEDARLRQELADSEKDKSELLMIVDLERNDLNKVCIPGSVKADKLFSIESYATVHHLVAEVSGKLREGATVIDVMKAAFPGGSITGAPKQRAMELLEQLEHTGRGLYTGSIGYISLNGDCDWNIVIRTAVYENGCYTIGIGGGITCESDPSAEYEETLQKAKAFSES